jgi:hypothetical protein
MNVPRPEIEPDFTVCRHSDSLLSPCSVSSFLFDQELGVTDDVDEEDMPDLEVEIVVRLRHTALFTKAAGHEANQFVRSASMAAAFQINQPRVDV